MNIRPKVRPTVVGSTWSTRFNVIIDREFSQLSNKEVLLYFRILGEIEGHFNLLGRTACAGHGVLTIGADYSDFEGEIEYYSLSDSVEVSRICTNIVALSNKACERFTSPFLMRFTFSQIARLR